MLKIAMLAAAALTLTAAGTSAKECVNGGFAASCDAGNCSCEFSPSSATAYSTQGPAPGMAYSTETPTHRSRAKSHRH